MSKVRHVLGISGGKDSAALAIYMKTNYPNLDIEYYTADTGKELKETYELIDKLEVFLGKKITRITAFRKSHKDPFDHKLDTLGGFLPSPQFRWCTKSLKLDPFEKFIGNDPIISYVGIRGDEDREGYISKKLNVQSIFPFRRNIWSEDVINKVLSNENIEQVLSLLDSTISIRDAKYKRAVEIISKHLSPEYTQSLKLQQLLDLSVKDFNALVFSFLKSTKYPLSVEEEFPLIHNEDILVLEDIFSILEQSGVGIPAYYNAIEFEVNGQRGTYARSRSGCFFCYYQQKIEWVWLFEQHPDLYQKAMVYEKDGYTWNEGETLAELSSPERIQQIKEDYLKRSARTGISKSLLLLDILSDEEDTGCATCFI